MLLNITNHPSHKWSSKQIIASQVYGEIVDLPFPSISPYLESKEIDEIVEEYLKKVKTYDQPVVLLQGEFIFTYRLIQRLKEKGYKVIAARSDRRTVEFTDKHGYTDRRSEFEFVDYLEY